VEEVGEDVDHEMVSNTRLALEQSISGLPLERETMHMKAPAYQDPMLIGKLPGLPKYVDLVNNQAILSILEWN
jgi:hypothetical protein